MLLHFTHAPSSTHLRLQLCKEGALNLKTVKHFILDECDKMLEKLGECARSVACVSVFGCVAGSVL